MNFESIPSSPENKRLAYALLGRSKSELFFAEATKFYWFACAISLGFFVFCCAAYIVTAAYFNFNKKDDFAILSRALEDGLKEVVFKTETSGSVALLSEPLRLRDGQRLQVDPKATISLAKGAELEIKGEIPITLPEVRRPTSTQMNSRNPVAAPSAYFTVFKSVSYRDGVISTGWRYLTSNQERPSNQYCYYSADLSDDGASTTLFFAENGQLNASVKPPQGFDLREAFQRCIWHEAN